MTATAPRVDPFAVAEGVADAVLFEGYVLYPYRASARKNQVRWQFGVLAPAAWAEADGSERSSCRTEVLVDPGAEPRLSVRVRFLQVCRRTTEARDGGRWAPVGSIEAGGVTHVPFAEALERVVDVGAVRLLPVAEGRARLDVSLPGGSDVQAVGAGRIVRTWEPLEARVEVATTWAAGDGVLLRASVSVANTTAGPDPGAARDDAVDHALVAVHTLLAMDDGAFVSLLDPPDGAAEAARACRSEGTYPVLVGEEASPTAAVVLSSPIILYDHPAVAPESPGDLFDATEIDEILALRVLTLTDEEKAEARGTDARAAAIVDRCEAMPPELWERLHGAVRSIGPATPVAGPDPTVAGAAPWWDPGADAAIDPFEDAVVAGGSRISRGTQVTLAPSRRADAHDLFLAGQAATVAGVFRDVDGEVHVAVTLDDDPAAELFGSTGRFWYFAPDEVRVR